MPNLTEQQIKNHFGDTLNGLTSEQFVSIVSEIYHKYDAANYDQNQKSIAKSAQKWQEILSELNLICSNDLNILDFGAGTGFVTGQLLNSSLNHKIKTIYCYDNSNYMLDILEKKYVNSTKVVVLRNQKELNEILASSILDIITTNSVIHHLLQPDKILSLLLNSLKKDGFYIAGHEPNKRFYANNLLIGLSKVYIIYKKIKNRVKLKKHIDNEPNVNKSTSEELFQKKITNRLLSGNEIQKLVDIHVPIITDKYQMWGEIGFDASKINEYTQSNLKQVYFKAYTAIKDPSIYKDFIFSSVNELLEKLMPNDGSECIMVFKK